MTFAQMNLNPLVFKAITACGYTTPTPIQARSIPDILNGRDLVASAQTGTGKTAAFVLPALHLLSLAKSTARSRILILTPTRELATQITQAASKYGKFLNFNIVSLVGGMPYRQQLRELSRPVDIIVATPGRLLDHMANHKLNLSGIEMLVLDEADRMLDMGFIDDVKEIAKATPNSRQTLLFSATVDDKLSTVIRHLLKDPVRIDLSTEIMAPTLITQEVYLADNLQHKTRLLQHFLDNGNIYKAIIFSATKVNADNLTRQLRDQGYEAAALHGDLKQNVRNKTIEQLRRGKIQFLVATDVAARGIDINDITHVINYDLPKFSEDYVHRIGRTGRAGKTGIAISLALPLDARHLQKIERYIGQKLPLSTVPGLEPTKRMNTSAAAAPQRQRHGGKSSRPNDTQGSGYKRKGSDAKKSYARDSDSKGSYARGGDAKKSYARDSDSKSSYVRGEDSKKSYTRDSDSKSSYARGGDAKKSYARDSDSKSSYARGGDAKKSYARDSDSKSSYARGGDAKKSYARDSDSKSSFTRGGDAKKSYARDSDSKSSFARGGDAKRSYARDSDSKSSFARGGDVKKSYVRDSDSKSSSYPRDSDAKKSYTRDGDSKISYVRSSEPKRSYARTADGKSPGPRSSGARGSATKSRGQAARRDS